MWTHCCLESMMHTLEVILCVPLPPYFLYFVWFICSLFFLRFLSLSFRPSLITLILFSFCLWDWIIIYHPDPSSPSSCLYLSHNHSPLCVLLCLLLSVSLFHCLFFTTFLALSSFQLKQPFSNLYLFIFPLFPLNLNFLPLITLSILSPSLLSFTVPFIVRGSVFYQKSE